VKRFITATAFNYSETFYYSRRRSITMKCFITATAFNPSFAFYYSVAFNYNEMFSSSRRRSITAYIPSLEKWEKDYKTRRKK